MTIKVYMLYQKQVWSFYNKGLRKGMIFFFLFILLVGICVSDPQTTAIILSLLGAIDVLIGIRTWKIKKEFDGYIKNGVRCHGRIVDYVVEEGRYNYDTHSRPDYVYLIVEYIDPYTNECKTFRTEEVNANPYVYLSSLDVTVYVMPDGKAWATDFQRVKKLKDAVQYKDPTLRKKKPKRQ